MQCLAECKEAACPVCRYTQQPLGMDCKCSRCDASLASQLWMCLVCGSVSCGRDVRQHALAHFKETQHAYAINLENKRVWDYASDNFAHRLIQSSENKIVDYENAKATKIADIEMKYSQIALDQLAAFEREKAKAKYQHDKEIRELKAANEALVRQRDVALKNAADAHKASAIRHERDEQLEKKAEELRAVTRQLEQKKTELDTANELNKSLCENQRMLKERIADLESQLSDLMRHLDFAEKIEQDPELQGGDLGVTRSSSTRSSAKGGRRGRHKKK